jgi:hypothetical protein
VDTIALMRDRSMFGSMKSDQKKTVSKIGGATPKAAVNLAGKPGIALQYERLCLLREKVRLLSEKARATHAKGQH